MAELIWSSPAQEGAENYHLHLTGETTDAQKAQVTCSQRYNELMVWPESEAESSVFPSPGLHLQHLVASGCLPCHLKHI